MFYDRFLELCSRKCVAPSRAAIDAGISKSLVSKWKANEAKKPSPEVVRKLAEYFGVSNYEILEDMPNQKEKTPTLTKKDERDIAKKLDVMLDQLGATDEALMFDGDPLDDETRELLRASLKNQLEMTKRMAKQKYTPKKYRG